MGKHTLRDLEQTKGIKILHLNVRSLLKKIDQLKIYFDNSKLDVVTLSETWTKSSVHSQLLQIEGFETIRQDRNLQKTNKKTGGGLITYIKTSKFPDYSVLDKLSTSDSDIEAQWIKIKRIHCKNIIICNLYRPPSGRLENALDYLTSCIKKMNRNKCNIYIIGDLNINYLNKSTRVYKKLNFFQKSNGLNQIINDTTRHNDKSSTLLDLILTDDCQVAECGTLDMMISDHQPIYVVKKKGREKRDQAMFEGRSYANLNTQSFKERLADLCLDPIYDMDTPQDIWDHLLKCIQEDLDKFCPIRKFVIRNYKPDWVTPNLLEQIRDRDYYYTKAKKSKDIDDWNIAKHLRNVTNRNIRHAKAEFILTKLDQFKGDSARFWKEIKKVFPTKGNNGHFKITLKNNRAKVEENQTANFINDFFINVGNTVVKRGKPNKQLKDRGILPVKWAPERFTENEVFNIIRKIKTSKSPGIDNANGTVIKEAFSVLIEALTFMFNLSIEQGIFPDSWKLATVVPIPKTGDPTQVSNLRPISLVLLPQPGKILEKLVHNQLTHVI